MGNAAVAEVERAIAGMKRGGGPGRVLASISRAREAAKETASRWHEVEDTDGFYFYHGAASADLVLSVMERRFRGARGDGAAGRAASDSLRVLPLIDRALEAAEGGPINKRSIDRVLDRTRVMVEAAVGSGLMISLEESQKRVDPDLLGRNLGPLMERLGSRCQPPGR